MRKALSITIVSKLKKQRAAKLFRDNPILDRLIEVGTKALRRGLMSGETLRAPRQQLRRLRASAFDLLPKSPAIARLSGARCVFRFLGETLCKAAIRPSQSGFLAIQKNVQVIRKNLAWVAMPLGTRNSGAACTHFCVCTEKLFA
jgi:hypothetical protein